MVNSVNTAQTDVVVSWVNDELPVGFLPYDEFVQKFSLGNTSTEQVHERTKHLSQMMQADPVKGLELLLHADNAVLSGFELFTSQIATLAPKLAEKMKAGGRIFLVGSGSSGRMGIDIAAKCNKSALIQGVIAGGDSAMIRAKEGFEDSEADGATAMEALKLTSKDTVFLISSSGSASFNVGCGHFAANLGAEVFYFYNSKEIPERTQKLFSRTNNPVHPLELDIGAQAITGSTRLQGASLAEMCLGGLLGTAILHLEGKKEAEQYPLELFLKVREGNRQIRNNLEKIANFVQKEADVFLSPSANFRLLYDLKPQGYVTLLGDKSCLREILIDATETSPTFSMNPIRREKEVASKREEFRAYLIDEKENRAAWKALLGREVNAADLADIDQFLLSSKSSGQHALTSRPTGAGNFVIGVAKVRSPSDAKDLSALLSQMKGETGMILLSREKGKLPSNIPPLTLHLEGVPFDRFGIVETLLLKQTLNLISNGSMVLSGKVLGNRMIDVRAANQKLVDRSMRLVKDIWADTKRKFPLTDEELYHYVAHICSIKQKFTEQGVYTPSIVKVVLSMLHFEKETTKEDFEEVVSFLMQRQEKLDFLYSEMEPLIFCIDGGGSKTLLQVIDAEGNLVPLIKNGKEVQAVESAASNINVVKKEGVEASLNDLFDDLKIGIAQKDAKTILSTSKIVAGMAGVALSENFETVTSLFERLGANRKNLQLLTDAELALQLINGNGIVLIAGTGSICFAEKNKERFRVGGLGRVLGDEGSGYQIGLQAIQAAMAHEFGYGEPTSLTLALRAFFKVDQAKSLLPKINSLEMSSAAIASVSSIVFAKAKEKDPVALSIISRAAEDLRKLVETALKVSKLTRAELHLWGGVFKDPLAYFILDQLKFKGVTVVNNAKENAAVIFARTFANKGK